MGRPGLAHVRERGLNARHSRRIEEIGQGTKGRGLQGRIALGASQDCQPLVRTAVGDVRLDARTIRFGSIGEVPAPLQDQSKLGPRKMTVLLRAIAQHGEPARGLVLLVRVSTYAHAH
jgi:hypothetical protein